jgi:hypothetical protein
MGIWDSTIHAVTCDEVGCYEEAPQEDSKHSARKSATEEGWDIVMRSKRTIEQLRKLFPEKKWRYAGGRRWKCNAGQVTFNPGDNRYVVDFFYTNGTVSSFYVRDSESRLTRQ